MDPSYSFQFSNEDSQREEENDISGVLTGSYSYKTPGGQDILVKYKAGADTGFVIQNMDEVNAAIERSASEPVAVKAFKAQPYSGETAEVEFEGPGVNADMDLENNYRFGYKVSDQEVKQEADAEGEVTGSYSYNMEDGRVVEVRYTAGKNGFKVENLDKLMATVHEDSEGGDALGQYGAQAAADVAAVVVAKAAEIPASFDYDNYEPYVHEEIAAEPYVLQVMPYARVDVPADPYVHEEPVISAKVAPPPSTTS